MMKRLLLLAGFVGFASVAQAQVPTSVVPTSADVLILPAVGDPTLTAPIATRTTLLPGTVCNLAASPVGPTPLINPSAAEVPDPFTAGRVCRLPIPIGLPNGASYRAVVVFAGTGCTDTTKPCTSDRSLVGVPFFDIAGTQVRPAAPTSVAVRP